MDDVRAGARSVWPASIKPILDKPAEEACPWLYLHVDPDARAAFVTADHRCEIRPDEVPGPGHQLAYCLTTNHVSCPQLRNYEARRRAATEVDTAPATVQAIPEAPATTAGFRASLIGGSDQVPPHRRRRGLTAGRVVWTAVGALGALAFTAGLLLYVTPNSVASEPGTTNATLPSVSAPTPNASDELAGAQPTVTVPPVATIEAVSVSGIGEGSSESSDEGVSGQDSTDTGAHAQAEAADAETTPEPTGTPEAEPPPPPSYVVRPGDTLGLIAQNLGISVIDLAIANDITTNTLIFAGDTLNLPVADDAAPITDPTPAN